MYLDKLCPKVRSVESSPGPCTPCPSSFAFLTASASGRVTPAKKAAGPEPSAASCGQKAYTASAARLKNRDTLRMRESMQPQTMRSARATSIDVKTDWK